MFLGIKRKYQFYILIFVTASALAVFYYFIFKPPRSLYQGEAALPPAFVEAYSAAADLSRAVSEFAAGATARLNEISEADRSGNYIRALDLTVEQAKQHEELRTKSVELLTELQKMAASVENIPSPTAQQLILQAVSTQVSLVSHLLAYNEYWISLLNHLRDKFLSADPSAFNPKTEELIQKINNEITIINGLNRRYHSLIEEFKKAI